MSVNQVTATSTCKPSEAGQSDQLTCHLSTHSVYSFFGTGKHSMRKHQLFRILTMFKCFQNEASRTAIQVFHTFTFTFVNKVD